VGILENRVDHFDHPSTDDRRFLEGICQDNVRDEELALDNTEEKLGSEPKSVYVNGKRTRANQEKIRSRAC